MFPSDARDEEPSSPIVTTTRPAPVVKPDEKTRVQRQPPYNVIIFNDEEHEFDYVIDLLIDLFKHSEETAVRLTWKIHTEGRAIVYTTHRELAELKRDQVIAYRPDPQVKTPPGPMICEIEACSAG